MNAPAVTYSPAQVTHAEEMRKLVAEVLVDSGTRIATSAAVQLYAWAHSLAPACKHQGADVYHFNAERFSGSCSSCGADVRSQA